MPNWIEFIMVGSSNMLPQRGYLRKQYNRSQTHN